MDSLLHALTGAFGDHADAVAVAGQVLSWESLDRAVSARARDLSGMPVLLVTATASLDTVIAVVAGLKAGVPVVPIAPDTGAIERAHITADSQRPPAGSALILYTSGTTGMPKGVPVSREMMAACLDGVADAWAWTADDILVHGLPLYHVHGLVLGVLGALRHGSRLHHTGKPTAARYARAQGTLYFGVPTVWSRVASEPSAARALRHARLLVSGSAPLPPTAFHAITTLTGHRIAERYGMTETLITLSTRADQRRVPGTVGWPLPGVSTRVNAGRELEVKGATVFGGYLNRADAPFTADGWFRTGDLASIDPDGTHRILGRASTDLIKSGGYRIGAGEVEHALLAHPAVAEAAVVGAPHDDLGQEVVAYVVTRSAVAAGALIDFVAANLAAHKRPRRIVFVDSLPRNAMGKVLKQSLR